MKNKLSSILALGLAMTSLTLGSSAVAETKPQGDWYATLGGGYLALEKDEEVLGQQVYEARIGRDFGSRYSVEVGLGALPHVRDRQFRRPGQLLLGDETWGARLSADFLVHAMKLEDRGVLDPYLAVGAGVALYEEALENGHADPYLTAGAGAFVNLTDTWFLKPDYRVAVAGKDTEINHHGLLSVGYRFGCNEEVDQLRGKQMSDWKPELRVVYFDFDSAALTETSKAILQKNAEWMQMNPEVPLVLEGHCDERGTNEYNMALGQRRAQSVYDYLRGLGVTPERLRTVSYGEELPAVRSSTRSAWAKNRRVEFKLDEDASVVAE